LSNERIPPQDIDAEQSILGSILQNAEALKKASQILQPEHFYVPRHRKIFAAVVDLYRRGEPVDLVTVPGELIVRRQLDDVGHRKYILDLTDSVVSFANIEDHCNIVAEMAAKRAIIDFANQLIDDSYDPESASRPLLVDMRQAITAIEDMRLQKLAVRTGQDMAETLSGMLDQVRINHMVGLRTGYGQLDNLLLGLQPSYFIVLAARPKMGKTALSLNIATKIAIRDLTPTLFISLEMGERSLVQRFATVMGGVSSYRLRQGNLRDYELTEVARASGDLAASKLYLADMKIGKLGQILELIERSVDRLGVKAVFLDYLGLIRHYSRSRENEVAEISQRLKGVTVEYDIPLIALAQLNRQAEGVIPQLGHLKDSGAIEADADQVIFIHRPKDKEGKLERRGKIIIAKARNERQGVVDFDFDGAKMRFSMIDRIHEQQDDEE